MKFPIRLFGLMVVSLSLAAQNAPLIPSPLPGPAPVAKKKPVVHQIDINSAPKADLMKLPGITSALADKIVQGRPYLSKSHLVSPKVLDRGQYEAIRERIFALATSKAAQEKAKAEAQARAKAKAKK